jgi:hypothetical protein
MNGQRERTVKILRGRNYMARCSHSQLPVLSLSLISLTCFFPIDTGAGLVSLISFLAIRLDLEYDCDNFIILVLELEFRPRLYHIL